MKYTIITIDSNNSRQEYTTRSLKEAHKIYDRAINSGIYVESFVDSRGNDMQDRNNDQSAIGWNN